MRKDELHPLAVIHIQIAYVGLCCRQCGKKFETVEDCLEASTWDGQQPMHPECFEQFKHSETFKRENPNWIEE